MPVVLEQQQELMVQIQLLPEAEAVELIVQEALQELVVLVVVEQVGLQTQMRLEQQELQIQEEEQVEVQLLIMELL